MICKTCKRRMTFVVPEHGPSAWACPACTLARAVKAERELAELRARVQEARKYLGMYLAHHPSEDNVEYLRRWDVKTALAALEKS